MPKGYIAFILHAHLPFVHHPEHPNFFEERWLFEAISETYIPLINCFSKLKDEGVEFKLTLSISPTLISMLTTPLLQERYITYLNKLINLTEKEVERTREQPEFHSLSLMYLEKYQNDLYTFEKRYNRNLISAFKELQESGHIEIITCAATHGFIPLLNLQPEAVKAQISVGVQTYIKHFDRQPKGIWLPECGYIPEVEKTLVENKIEYIIIEAHGILFAKPRPIYATFAPIISPEGIIAFGRDTESSKQVWSSEAGYPGDYEYRDFYRDIGYDLDYNYIKPHILSNGNRIHTGIKYFKITGETPHKQPYNPKNARQKAKLHASDFLMNRIKQVEFLRDKMDNPPIIVCPYDAELFGHWWYEGPYWLYDLFKKIAANREMIESTSLSMYIENYPSMQAAAPCASSWGGEGYNEVWLNPKNDWIYRPLHKAAEKMVELANDYPEANDSKKDALNQAARELLLAQSSDWAFIMQAETMVEYAQKRTKDHLNRFTKLYYDIKENNIDKEWLEDIQWKDNIFPDIDYRIYRSAEC